MKCQDAHKTTHLSHQGFQETVVWLSNHPVSISTESPAGDGPHQRLLVRQAANQIGDELREVWHHPIHTALSNGTQHKDARLLYLPVLVKESLLKDWQ